MKKLVTVICFTLVGVTAYLLNGCETSPVSRNDLTISPESIGLHINEFADFTASGGFEYTWSLSDNTKGVLSTTNGPTTRYTDRFDPAVDSSNTTFVQIITVSSTIPESSNPGGTSASNSVTPAYIATAQAQVEHLPSEHPTQTVELVISPSSASLVQFASQPFTASGGDGSYNWSLEDAGDGKLSTPNGSSTTFTSTIDPGVSNSIVTHLYLSDGSGHSTGANLILTHQP